MDIAHYDAVMVVPFIEKVTGTGAEEINQYDEWDRERERYLLKRVAPAGYVYCLKEEYVCDDEPPHYICPTCAGNREKTLVQQVCLVAPSVPVVRCPKCATTIRFDGRFVDNFS